MVKNLVHANVEIGLEHGKETVTICIDSDVVCLARSSWKNIFLKERYKDDLHNVRKRIIDLTPEGNYIVKELMCIEEIERVQIKTHEVCITLRPKYTWCSVKEKVLNAIERNLRVSLLTL